MRVDTDYIHGIGKIEGGFVIILDVERTFTGGEFQNLQDAVDIPPAVPEPAKAPETSTFP